METVTPVLLMRQASQAPPSPNRPSNPAIASQFTGSVQQTTSSSSPYPSSGRQGAWMGSVGFTTRFTRDTMGYGRVTQTPAIVYEPEPLQPLFGGIVPLSSLPEPTSESMKMPPSGHRIGGDMAWLFGRPQSGYVERPKITTCNGEQRLVAQRMYISRGFRDAGMSR